MSTSNNRTLQLKQQGGWFAAGDGFRRAVGLLSDGAFKLFAWLCMEADRHTGRLESTHIGLARAVGKSKRAIGIYVAELERKGVCRVQTGTNQYARTCFEMCDEIAAVIEAFVAQHANR